MCRLLVLALAALTIGPAIWRYCFQHSNQVTGATRRRIQGEHARSEQIREQVEMPTGRRMARQSDPTPRGALTRPFKE